MTSDSANFQTLLNQGHTAVWNQDWSKAVELYQSALNDSPDHLSAMAGLGLAYFQSREYAASLEIFEKLTGLQSEDPMPFNRIARIHERMGNLHDAAAFFLRAAKAHLQVQDTDQAIANLNSVLALEPQNQPARSQLALIFDKTGRKAEAVSELLALASILQHAGEKDKSLQSIDYALQLVPDSIDAKTARNMITNGKLLPLPEKKRGGTGPIRMAQVQKLNSTEVIPGELSELDPVSEAKVRALKDMADMLFIQEEGTSSSRVNRQRSASSSEILASSQEERERIQIHLGQSIDSFSSGHVDEARKELERAIDLGLNLPAAYYIMGWLSAAKDQQKALNCLQKSVRNPQYALASYLLMGGIYEQTGQLTEASANFLQALRLADAESVPAEKTEEILQLYDPIFESLALITQEKDLKNLCTAIHGQLTRNDWRAYLKAARAQLPPVAEGLPPLPLAEMLMESTSSQVVDSLAQVRKLVSQGKLRAAMEEAFAAITYAPAYLPLHIQIGDILITQGRVQEAVEKYRQVARLYQIRGEMPQAIRLLNKVAKLAPMDIAARTDLIDMLKSIGRYDDAIQQTLDLANAHYLLADLEAAREAYRSALSITRQSSDQREWSIKILGKLADIELQSLDMKGAVKVYEQLRNILPEDPATRMRLIDIYLRMNMNQAALNEVDAFLKLTGDGEDFADTERFLDDLTREYPNEPGLQELATRFYSTGDRLPGLIEKLDNQARDLLRARDIQSAIAKIQQIIDLDPPNQIAYKQLLTELRKKI